MWGRLETKTLNCVKDKIFKKLQGWKQRLLNEVGWEVLINAIACVVLTYSMGIFKFMLKWCDQVNSWLVKFWWG